MSTVERLSSTINEGSQDLQRVATNDQLQTVGTIPLPTIPNWPNQGDPLSSIDASNTTTTDEPIMEPNALAPAPPSAGTDVPVKARRRLAAGTLAAPPPTGAVFAPPFRTYTGPPGLTLEEVRATTTANRLPRQLGGSISIASSVSLTDDVAEEAFENMKTFRDEIRTKVKDFVECHDAAVHGVGDAEERNERILQADWKRANVLDMIWRFVASVRNYFPTSNPSDVSNRRRSAKAAMFQVTKLFTRPILDEDAREDDTKRLPTLEDFGVTTKPREKRDADDSMDSRLPGAKRHEGAAPLAPFQPINGFMAPRVRSA